MSLVCNICNIKAEYRLVIDIDGWSHRFFYCLKHKPKKFELQKMNFKQDDNGTIIMQELFEETEIKEE